MFLYSSINQDVHYVTLTSKTTATSVFNDKTFVVNEVKVKILDRKHHKLNWIHFQDNTEVKHLNTEQSNDAWIDANGVCLIKRYTYNSQFFSQTGYSNLLLP